MKISNYKNKFLPPKIKTNFLKNLINEKNYLFFAIPCLRGAEKAALNLCNDLSKQYLVTIIMLNKKIFQKSYKQKYKIYIFK